MMNENDILGFDPKQLFEAPDANKTQSAGNPLIYKTRCADSVDEDEHYRCTIKLVLNPFNFKRSILEQQSYAMQDLNGWFTVISSLTNNDTSCPIFTAWKKCRYAEEGSDLWLQQAKPEEGGKSLFDKRFARYVTVQVLEDKNQPEAVGKYLFWKLPKAVYDIIDAQMNPSEASGKSPKPIMDFLFGKAIELEVIPGPDDKAHPERKARETSYRAELTEDFVSVINPDGSPILNDDEQEVLDKYISMMKKVWNSKDPDVRKELLATINADENTVALRKIYSKVLEEIKQVCPNIVEKLGYNEWDDKTKKRVQDWIDVVLAGNNPVNTVTPEVAEAITSGNVEASTATVDTSDETSDLPF